MGVAKLPIRYRPDTGVEYRCADCAKAERQCYWPVTAEFWNFRYGFTRCRACWIAYKRRDIRARRLADPGYRKEYDRQYHIDHRDTINFKRRLRRAEARERALRDADRGADRQVA